MFSNFVNCDKIIHNQKKQIPSTLYPQMSTKNITETSKFIHPEQSRSRNIPISLLLGLISLPIIFWYIATYFVS